MNTMIASRLLIKTSIVIVYIVIDLSLSIDI